MNKNKAVVKNIIRILSVAFAMLVFCSCEDPSYEKLLVKSVNQYLNRNLKDPGSLKDLEIIYAILSQGEIDDYYEKQVEKYKANPFEEVLPVRSHASERKAIVLIRYRAKNSFGAYDKGFDAFEYYPYGDERLDLQTLSKAELYLLEAMLYSPNQKVIK